MTTMTHYSDDLDTPVAFPPQTVDETMAQVLAENGLRQLHAAETEKYAHVTYFFNGGREEEWPGETRSMVPSPREIGTYDKKPEMAAGEVAERFCEALEQDGFSFAIVNFANPDMVGHTGFIPAVVKAVETTDACLARVVETVERLGGVTLVTADHGNAETMLESRRHEPSHGPHVEPGPACRHGSRGEPARRWRAEGPRAHRACLPGAHETLTDDRGKSLQMTHFGWPHMSPVPSILRRPCRLPSPI